MWRVAEGGRAQPNQHSSQIELAHLLIHFIHLGRRFISSVMMRHLWRHRLVQQLRRVASALSTVRASSLSPDTNCLVTSASAQSNPAVPYNNLSRCICACMRACLLAATESLAAAAAAAASADHAESPTCRTPQRCAADKRHCVHYRGTVSIRTALCIFSTVSVPIRDLICQSCHLPVTFAGETSLHFHLSTSPA